MDRIWATIPVARAPAETKEMALGDVQDVVHVCTALYDLEHGPAQSKAIGPYRNASSREAP
eukprot:3991358-Lingulodinium_polyedra.AAC.1